MGDAALTYLTYLLLTYQHSGLVCTLYVLLYYNCHHFLFSESVFSANLQTGSYLRCFIPTSQNGYKLPV